MTETQRPPQAVTRLILTAVLVAALALAALASISLGSRPLDPGVVWEALTQRRPGLQDHDVIWDLRVPRTVAGLAVGACVAVAGALIQAVTRNPLADPGILGVNAGATCAIAVGVAFLGLSSVHGQIWAALVGALLATVAVSVIGAAGGGPMNPIRLTLAGAALAAVLLGMTTAITLTHVDAFNTLRHWSAGSLTSRPLSDIAKVTPFMAAGLLITAMVARSLNTVALGEDLATSLGAKVHRVRLASVVAVTLTCGAATAIAGPIGFVGLMVPHVVRWVVGPHQVWILALSAMGGPSLLLMSDVVARLVVTGELPVGVVTAFVGAPVLISMARGRKVSGL